MRNWIPGSDMRCLAIPLCLSLPWILSGQPAVTFGWPKDLNSTPVANRTSLSAIESLVNQVLSPNEHASLKVAEFHFVPLETVSRIDLIASVDLSGRGWNSFFAIWQTPDGYGSALLPSYRNRLATDVIDIDGAGIYQVVARELSGIYLGTATPPIPWCAVYTLRGGKWINVSDRYPNFFWPDQVLSAVRSLTGAFDAGDKALVELYRVNEQFVSFKYERMVLHHTNAGLESALGWSSSANRAIRVLAIKTLCDADDPRATAALQKLSEDAGTTILAKDASRIAGHAALSFRASTIDCLRSSP
jgi:hypothetical protein